MARPLLPSPVHCSAVCSPAYITRKVLLHSETHRSLSSGHFAELPPPLDFITLCVYLILASLNLPTYYLSDLAFNYMHGILILSLTLLRIWTPKKPNQQENSKETQGMILSLRELIDLDILSYFF